MTREELKIVLASKENKLAEKLIGKIRDRAPLAEIKELVEAGASKVFYQRDPRKPRSAYIVKHVLDECFKVGFGILEKQENSVILGHITAKNGGEEIFEYLLENGFTPGDSGYSGPLFKSIVSSCFYGNGDKDYAKALTKILIRHGKIDIQLVAENNYYWTGNLEKLETILELGAKPTDKMMDTVVRYCACSPNNGETKESRAAVVRKLHELGAKPIRIPAFDGMDFHTWPFLEKYGLDELIFPDFVEKRKAFATKDYPDQEDAENVWAHVKATYGETPLFKLKEELSAKEGHFSHSGGRGVELADQIDLLRVAVASKEFTNV